MCTTTPCLVSKLLMSATSSPALVCSVKSTALVPTTQKSVREGSPSSAAVRAILHQMEAPPGWAWC